MKNHFCAEKPRDFADLIHRHLHMYALAAGAAGVSILALAPPGSAEIIYTPVNDVITNDFLDLNNDGTIDFHLFTWSMNPESTYALTGLDVEAAQTGNGVMGGGGFASALRPGVLIGPADGFASSQSMQMAKGWFHSIPRHQFHYCKGPWKGNHYLGLRFMINGEVHYGWAQVTARCYDGFVYGWLHGYAYETVPNQALKAGRRKGALEEGQLDPTSYTEPTPAPATLGHLAKGAGALSTWRTK